MGHRKEAGAAPKSVSPPLTSDPATVAITIGRYEGVSSGGGILRIGGTSDADVITSSGGVLTFNGATVSTAGVTEIRIWGRDGSDSIDLSGLAIPTFVCGGFGDDTILGGMLEDLLLGGGGGDTITGGAGNDFLIGGSGADRLVGSAGNDLLASGEFGPDATLPALRDLRKLWSDSAVSSVEEAAVDAIFEQDGAVDQLTGSSEADWFIINTGDKITDFKPGKKDGDLVTVIS